jgi:biotin carboxyl carrier protein
MPGKVIEIRVAVGDTVEPGQTLVLLEAMKMEHPMQATEAGTVQEILVSVGEQVEHEALLLVVNSGAEHDASENEETHDG